MSKRLDESPSHLSLASKQDDRLDGRQVVQVVGPQVLRNVSGSSTIAAVRDIAPFETGQPSVALNARVEPTLWEEVKLFCATNERKHAPKKITLQDFVNAALQHELERQSKRIG